MLGYTREELLRMGVPDIDVGAGLPADFSWEEHIKEVRRLPNLLLESVHKRKDGTTFPVEINIKVFSLEDREYMVSIARDITQRKAAEEELQKHRKNLERLVTERTEQLANQAKDLERSQQALQYLLEDVNEAKKELEQANQLLQELDRLKAMFIASMSHELRTPLNSIIGFTGIILQGLSGEIGIEQKDQLKRVYRSGKHLLALINDVIDISKIEAGKIEIHVEQFDLEGVIDEAVSTLKPEIDEKGLALEVTPAPGLLLGTDRKRLLQCILNYLGNAVKFTLKGKISIMAQEFDDMVEITVKDTGIGIKAGDIPKLFGSFARMDSPLRTAVLGTGLGLYLTKKLTREVLQGSVGAESTYGEGSTFWLKFPKTAKIVKAADVGR